jgi:hypothetical protein
MPQQTATHVRASRRAGASTRDHHLPSGFMLRRHSAERAEHFSKICPHPPIPRCITVIVRHLCRTERAFDAGRHSAARRQPYAGCDTGSPLPIGASSRSAMPRSPSLGRISGPSTVMTFVGRWAYLPLPHPHAAGAPRMTVLSGYSWRNDRAHSVFCETMCDNAKSA